MFSLYKKLFGVSLVLCMGTFASSVEARLIFSNENPEWDGSEFIIDIADEATTNVDLRFGNAATGRIRFDVANDNFEINKDVDFEGNKLVNVGIENLAAAPTCDVASTGRIYINTTNDNSFVCNGIVFEQINGGSSVLQDEDGDTLVQVEEGVNDDTIRFDTAGAERLLIDAGGNLILGATAETIDTDGGAFLLDGGDAFIANELGVEGAIYTDDTATKYQFLDIFGCVRGSATAGNIGGRSPVVRFDEGDDSQMRCLAAVPDDWVAGTDIDFEVFWTPSDNAAGDLFLEFDYGSFGVGDTIVTASFTDTVLPTQSIAASTQGVVSEFAMTVPSAEIALDEMINFRFRRQPDEAADTYAADINIHMIRMAYTGKKLR